MFGRNKKITKLQKTIEELRSEPDQKEEEIADLEYKIETQSAEIDFLKTQNERISKERNKLSGEISELRKRNAQLEALERVQDINVALTKKEKQHTEKINELSNEITFWMKKVETLEAQLQQQKSKKSKQIPEDEQVRIRMNKERFDLEEELSTEKAFSKSLLDRCSELRKELTALKAEIKKPRDYKFKYTRTETFYVKEKNFQHPADISVVTYSIYSVDEETYKLKEQKQTEYFLERFYWPNGGYTSFEPSLQLFPDNIARTYKGTDNKTYTLTFIPQYKVAQWDVSVKHVSVIRRLTSKTLSNAIGMFEKFSKLFKRYDDHFEKLQIVSEEFDKLNEEFKLLQKDYSENIKKLESDAKKVKDRFNKKFEKYSKGQ